MAVGNSTLAVDDAGYVYIANYWSNCLQVFREGRVETVAGTCGAQGGYGGDGGPATKASLNQPLFLQIDAKSNIYFSDSGNHCVRFIEHDTGFIFTEVGTCTVGGYQGDGDPSSQVLFNTPGGLALDDEKGYLYIADGGNFRVRRLDLNLGTVSLVAGNGRLSWEQAFVPTEPALTSAINPVGLALDAAGDLFIADYVCRVRKVSFDDGMISTVVGNPNDLDYQHETPGQATEMTVHIPWQLAIDTLGTLYISDVYDQRILRIDP